MLVPLLADTTAVEQGMAAIIHFVYQLVLQQSIQSPEDAGLIHTIQPLLHIGQCKRVGTTYDFPHKQYPVSSRLYTSP